MLRLHSHSSRFPDQVGDMLIRGDLPGWQLLREWHPSWQHAVGPDRSQQRPY
ncbi:MAG: hypothetical protein ABFD75_11430 [Smithella sp.]